MSDDLRKTLLGFFDLKTTTTIFPAAHASAEEFAHTFVHEESHRKLASSTTYGVMQMIFAFLAGKDLPPGAKLDRVTCERILDTTISHCWNVQEGFAVFRARAFDRFTANARVSPSLPADYERAFGEFAKFAGFLPDYLKPISPFLAHNLAEISLNSPILEDLPIEEMSLDSIHMYLLLPQNSPDMRLRRIIETLGSLGFEHSSSRELLQNAQRVIDTCAEGEAGSIDEQLANAFSSAGIPQFKMIEGVQELTTQYMEKVVAERCRDIAFRPAIAALKECGEYHQRTQKLLRKSGIELFGLRDPSSRGELSLAGEEVEYPVDGQYSERIHDKDDANGYLDKLSESSLAFAIQLARYPATRSKVVIQDAYIYALYVFLADRCVDVGGRAQQSNAFELRRQRDVFIGNWEFIHTLAERFIFRKSIVCLEWSCVDGESLQPVRPVSQWLTSLATKGIMVAPSSRGSFTVSILEKLRAVGLNEAIPLYKHPLGTIQYFMVETVNGDKILLKMSQRIPGILSMHFGELWNWFMNNVPSFERLTQTEQLAQEFSNRVTRWLAIAKMESLGAFWLGTRMGLY